jgi:release factor glutamine methyltransferase
MDVPARHIDWLLREKHSGKMTAAAERDIARLQRGEPLDYVIGFSEFLGCTIDLSAFDRTKLASGETKSVRPLIPRPETEYWTEKVIAGMRRQAPPRVLDIFCGSGAIGIAVLKHVPAARVMFADIEPAYFPGIRRSLRSNGISSRRAAFLRSDIFAGIPRAERHDYILANPPYIPLRGRRVQASVRRYEPPVALFAGPEGLKFIRPLIRQAKAHLLPQGELVLEFDPPQKKAIAALARRSQYGSRFFRDQYGRWRYAILKSL